MDLSKLVSRQLRSSNVCKLSIQRVYLYPLYAIAPSGFQTHLWSKHLFFKHLLHTEFMPRENFSTSVRMLFSAYLNCFTEIGISRINQLWNIKSRRKVRRYQSHFHKNLVCQYYLHRVPHSWNRLVWILDLVNLRYIIQAQQTLYCYNKSLKLQVVLLHRVIKCVKLVPRTFQ